MTRSDGGDLRRWEVARFLAKVCHLVEVILDLRLRAEIGWCLLACGRIETCAGLGVFYVPLYLRPMFKADRSIERQTEGYRRTDGQKDGRKASSQLAFPPHYQGISVSVGGYMRVV